MQPEKGSDAALGKGKVWSKRQLGGARPLREGKVEGTVPAQGLGRRKGAPQNHGPWG